MLYYETININEMYSYLRPSPKRKHFRESFYVCHVTRLVVWNGSHLDAKADGSVTANVMLCHALMHVFYKKYKFRGVEACLGFEMIQKR